ncbi:MAG: ribulose-phosphate 3-epimerase [Treponema sp.]|nr:ribulose-phosphate 3-epimerase [Treponema sp.]MCI6591196.1 ribulose-phosphate 3-epimerase [Spirochaetia bacterium]MDD7533908.1 ribulose-phosphate 3-epimerase [Treponema sp.]MDY3721169.1 ribulose-phosphate 3-epimerase [Treponema sp.]MDY5757500.1 ribulose-phosphate 3-epimerase [Treponema sp.]
MKNQILAPSLLSADFADLGGEIKKIENNNGGAVHIDVMDGSFVPEITYGEPVIRSIRKLTKLPFDVHLMVDKPELHVASFAEAGADWITFHFEATNHAHRIIQMIHEKGKKAGVAVCPGTSLSILSEILPCADIILVMTVNPGWGGQKIIPSCVEKVAELKKYREEHGLNYRISVDGGINNDTLKSVIDAGTDIVVSGSCFFNGSLKWS